MSRPTTTIPGYLNPNKQRVVDRVDWVEANADGQYTYKLRCERYACGHEYGADGRDIHHRKCPRCQDGKPGAPVPDRPPTLFG